VPFLETIPQVAVLAREGCSLLEALGAARFEGTPMPTPSETTLDDLFKWQTRWFPIAEATLGRRLPTVKTKLFKNIGRARRHQRARPAPAHGIARGRRGRRTRPRIQPIQTPLPPQP
jgi:hypothetical protein